MGEVSRLARLIHHLRQDQLLVAAAAPAAGRAVEKGEENSRCTSRGIRPDRLRGALAGMFIGDALAVPAHWYYNRDELLRDYGVLTTYTQVSQMARFNRGVSRQERASFIINA